MKFIYNVGILKILGMWSNPVPDEIQNNNYSLTKHPKSDFKLDWL